MEAPRLVELSSYRVAKRRYSGAPPPDGAFFAHWRDLNRWAAERGLESPVADIVMIGYEPPGPAGSRQFAYDACIPVPNDFQAGSEDGVTIDSTPPGSYVLCTGELLELPQLHWKARRYAVARGLPCERGGIELYRLHPGDAESLIVDAGCRIHQMPDETGSVQS